MFIMKTIRTIIDESYKEGFTLEYELRPRGDKDEKQPITLIVYGIPDYIRDAAETHILRELDEHWPMIVSEFRP